MSGLRRRIGDRAAARHALARRQRAAALDVIDEELQRAPRVRVVTTIALRSLPSMRATSPSRSRRTVTSKIFLPTREVGLTVDEDIDEVGGVPGLEDGRACRRGLDGRRILEVLEDMHRDAVQMHGHMIQRSAGRQST